MFHWAVKKCISEYHQHNSERVTCKALKVRVLVLSLGVLHTALVMDMIPLHSLPQIDGGQISTI